LIFSTYLLTSQIEIEWKAIEGTVNARLEEANLKIKLQKFVSQLEDIAYKQQYLHYTPKDFNIIGNGTTDDTANIQLAFNTMKDGDSIKMKGSYLINKKIIISKKIKIYGNPTFIVDDNFDLQGTNSFILFRIIVDKVELENVSFLINKFVGARQNNAFIWCSNGGTRISKCNFKNLPLTGNNFNGAIAFLAGGAGFNKVGKCKFEACTGGVFTQQPHDIIENNIAINPKDVSFVINGPNAHDDSIKNNKVYSDGTTSAAGSIAIEQGAGNFEIAGNYIYGIRNGYGVGIVDVGGYTAVGVYGLVHNNIIDGANFVSTNGQAGLKTDSYYDGIKIYNNIIKNIGSGHPSNSPVQLAVSDCDFYNNKIKQTDGNIGITINGAIDRAKTLKLTNNDIDNNSKSWAIKISGKFRNSIIKIQGCEISNAIEGINSVSCSVISDLILDNNKFKTVTTPVNGSFSY